jgi:ATP-dependent DNA helicase Rep
MRGDKARQDQRKERKSNEKNVQHRSILHGAWTSIIPSFAHSVSRMSAGLNFAQQEAVNFLHGPCLVLAGAGSGKTRVITHKIGRLIQAGCEPDRIAAITFTNKAATEMRERAKGLIGRAAKDVLICTFHALGVRMLRQDGGVMGLKPQFSIMDSSDVTGILKDAGGTSDAATARTWQWTISLWKNMGLNSAQAMAIAKDDNERIIAKIMERYEERLSAYQSVDFDDLIGMPLKLLQEHEEVRLKWQAQLGHVLVDEYQDTNATQYEVLKWTTCANCRKTSRTSRSSSWSKTTAPPVRSCGPRTT